MLTATDVCLLPTDRRLPFLFVLQAEGDVMDHGDVTLSGPNAEDQAQADPTDQAVQLHGPDTQLTLLDPSFRIPDWDSSDCACANVCFRAMFDVSDHGLLVADKTGR